MGNIGGRKRDVTDQNGVTDQSEARPPSRDATCQTETSVPTLLVSGVNLSAERTVNSSTTLVKYTHTQNVFKTKAPPGGGESSAQASPQRQHSLDGISDNFLLGELLHELEDKILHKQGLFQKLKRAYGLLDRKPGHFDPHQPWDLFQAMVNEGRLSAYDVLCLQGLLHKCGCPDLVDLVTKHAKKMEAEHKIRVMHFSVPNIEPVQDDRYVSLHVTTEDVDGGGQGFLQKLARLLGVGVELIRVVGCQLTGSMWVTLLLPRACVDSLETALQQPQHPLHAQLALLGVDHVSTIQVAPDPTRRDLFEAAARGQQYEEDFDLDAVLKDSLAFLETAPDPSLDDPDLDREAAEGARGAAGRPRDRARGRAPDRLARGQGGQGSRRGREAAMM